MKVAFPTQVNQGMDSIVFEHFGSANFFILVDSETQDMDVVLNQDLNHQHGQCQPLKALGGRQVDAVVVGGIGGTAMGKLTKNGKKVYRAVEGSVKENLGRLKSGTLNEFMPFEVCGGHDHDGECGHH
ncbi:MAG: NifB/NifX family molybdenum-iron cluster-binding protein [Proteobacteria bacterium]|nr:NifB/NifX family molybdenum-iron cluster-binding protein [Pseudomonadota bacterium]